MSNAKSSPLIVGCDDGYAMTKLVILDGKVTRTLAIPSRIRSGIHGTSVIGAGEAEGEGFVAPGYSTDGMSFTVGDFADSESAKFDDYPFSPMNRVLVHHALRLAGLGGRKVILATGLPLSTFYNAGKANDAVIARKLGAFSTPVQAMDGSTTAEIGEHRVFPEGLAAWVDYAIADNGTLRAELLQQTVGVIDIGGRTTDVAVVLPGRRIDHARTGSAEIGVLNVIEEVGFELQRELGVGVPAHLVGHALRSRTVSVWGKKRDIGTLIDAATARILERVLREVNARLGSGVDLDRILLVGGGAHVFKGAASRYPNIDIPASPEFANARGFAKYLGL
jgi:plasmid segregation protein ParM